MYKCPVALSPMLDRYIIWSVFSKVIVAVHKEFIAQLMDCTC